MALNLPSLFVGVLPDVNIAGGLVLGVVAGATALPNPNFDGPGALQAAEYESEPEYLLDQAFESWESGLEAQYLRQEAGEYVPGEWVGSDWADAAQGK